MAYNNFYKAKMCMEAFKEVKATIHDNYGADNIGNPKREIKVGEVVAPIEAYVKHMRTQAKANGKGKGQFGLIKSYADAARHFKCGRCMGQASMVIIHLLNNKVNCSFVTVDMNDGDEHVFVVADAVKPAVGMSLESLGGTPVCDPWLALKAIVETTDGFGAGATTAVRHSASLKNVGYSSKIKQWAPFKVLNGG